MNLNIFKYENWPLKRNYSCSFIDIVSTTIDYALKILQKEKRNCTRILYGQVCQILVKCCDWKYTNNKSINKNLCICKICYQFL